MAADLSKNAKETFQVAALLATVLVVGIHYKSDIPDSPRPLDSTWNELLQEFWLGGIARVAVPTFAFAAGLFYFRSDLGTWACYRRKLEQRSRSVAFPYFIIASIATSGWLIVKRLRSETVDMDPDELLTVWLLHPPAEQLWFLRDLMFLIVLAPIIRWLTMGRLRQTLTATVFFCAWVLNWQPFPLVAGWYALSIETLLFFTLGAIASRHPLQINSLVGYGPRICTLLCAVWSLLVGARVLMRPDFDIWYRSVYSLPDLLVHQASIVVGCVALFVLSARLNHPMLRWLSGGSFFVFLVHEFPLRGAVDQVIEKAGDPPAACRIAFPLVVIGCYTLALGLSYRFPELYGLITGGRTPQRAASLANVRSVIVPGNGSGKEVTS